jgi:hypothetical protein
MYVQGHNYEVVARGNLHPVSQTIYTSVDGKATEISD